MEVINLAYNFLSQLTQKDFFEFISSLYDTTGFKETDINIIKLPLYDKGNPPKLKIVLKSSKKFGKSIPNPMIFYFYKFNFDREVMLSYMEERFVFSSINEPWRAFMAKKFGNEYVKAYENYILEYIQKEKSRLEKINSDCKFELQHLKGLIE